MSNGTILQVGDVDPLELGNPELPIVRAVPNGIVVDFVRMLGNQAVREYCFFPMSKKRNYLNFSPQVAAQLLPLVEGNDELGLALLGLHLEIRYYEDDPQAIVDADDLARRTVAVFGTTAVAKITELIDRAYGEVDIDAGRPSGNDELQFTNEHAKIILCWSWACLAATPIVTAYLEDRDIPPKEQAPVIMAVFTSLLSLFQVEGQTDILSKVQKFIESRINRTTYSDRVMWAYLQSLAVTPKTFAQTVFQRIVIDIIPKLEQGRNVVSYLHMTVKNQIFYMFITKFPLQYRPIRPNAMDSDGVGAQERLENELIRRDEGAAILADVNAQQALRDISHEVGLSLDRSDPEIQHWVEQLREHGINAWQKGLITKLYLPRFCRVEVIRTQSLEDYAVMLAAALRWLDLRELKITRSLLAARIEQSPPDRRVTVRKKFLRDFIESHAYRELLVTNFPHSMQAIVDSNVITNMINAMYGNDFVTLPDPRSEVAAGVALDYKLEAIAQEVLQFVSFITSGRDS